MTHAPEGAHYDALETRAADAREHALMRALPQQLAHARAHAPAFARSLAAIDPQHITSRSALAQLPVLRKHELLAAQHHADAPDVFGGFSAVGWGAARAPGARALRVFVSPGPIHEPDTAAPDHWRMARALYAAGFRAGDLAHNSFSYHFTPAGAMMESGAFAIGCTVFPAGTGQTEQQVQAMAALRPSCYVGTPSFLKIVLDKADELGVALPWLTKASVGGEAFPPGLRDWLQARGVAAYQSYGTADLGLIAYETPAREGLVLDEGVIVEIVRPGTGDVVAEGEVGEVVVTTLNPAYPLIRFGTVDLSAVLPGAARPGARTPASRAGRGAPTRPPRCPACSCNRSNAQWPCVASCLRGFRDVGQNSVAHHPITDPTDPERHLHEKNSVGHGGLHCRCIGLRRIPRRCSDDHCAVRGRWPDRQGRA